MCSGGYLLESGGIPLPNAVGINCKNGTTTENQGVNVKYVDDYVCAIRLDMTTPPSWRENAMVYYW